MRRLLVLAAGVLVLGPSAARAATITVDTTLDVVMSDGDCSLREAITSANLDAAQFSGAGECASGSGGDTVMLGTGTFTRSLAMTGENTNGSGDLDVTSALTIQGAGAALTTVDAGAKDRVIDVLASGNLTIRGVTITGGRAPDGLAAGGSGFGGNGGPSSIGGNGFGAGGDPGESGGGIRNAGTLVIL